MESVDALRKWADGLSGVWIDPNDHTITITTGWDAPPDMDSVSLRDHVNGILDGIEFEVKELTDERDLLKTQWEAGVDFDQRLAAAAEGRIDVTLFGVDYTAIPLDADGVPIHVGDVLNGYGKTIEVVELRIGRSGWVIVSRDGNAYADCAAFTHHHTPTVEDVLREFTRDWCNAACTGDMTNAERDAARANVVAEFAARLRMAGEE